jgi:hypothetical protein
MTAAIASQSKPSGSSTMTHTLTLAFAALTFVFALLSIILGNRLSTLQAQFLSSKIATATTEAASIQDMEAKLNAALSELESSQKNLDGEKAATERLRRQIAGVSKDLEKAKADLAIANQIIAGFKATEPAPSPEAAPSKKTVLPQSPAPQSVSQQSEPSMALPAPIQTPSKVAPEPSAAQLPASPTVKPDNQPVTKMLPEAAPLSPEDLPPVTEETISEATAAPGAD